MATATKKTAAKPPASAGVGDAEADVNNPAVMAAQAAVRERPEGMPAVWPLHALPRRKRALAEVALADCLDTLTQLQKDQQALQTEGEGDEKSASQGDMIRLHAKMQDLLADVTDALALGSPEADELRKWADDADEEALLSGFGWYVGTLQPGEADGSQ